MVNKKIKIVQVARFAKPHIGGIEEVIEQINSSLPDDKYQKEVICCSNTEKSSVENRVKYTRCRYLFDFAANSISPQLFFKMMFLKTDIIHFHMPVIQNVIIWFILYHLGLLKYKKLIITYHGAIIGYDKYMKPFWGIYRYFYSKADKIHVLSPNVIDSDPILTLYKEKCEIISYGIDTSVDNNTQEVQKIKNLYPNKKIILCCGRLVNFKGFQYVIQAMKNIDDAILFIIGDGPLLDSFNTYITENHLKDKIVLLGSISDNQLKEIYYQVCDIFVLASIQTSESFGIVQLEAMKYGKPIINTNLKTGVNYVSIDKETGITIESKNVEQLVSAIKELFNNDEQRMQYGRNAKKRVETLFDIKKIKEEYKNLYKGF